jgi:hypothetical protein
MSRSEARPWTCEGSPWKTESAFMNWVRGVLRKGWKVHPIKIEFINKYRKRIKNPNEKSAKRFPECWGMTCDICQKDAIQSDIQIDHRGDSGTFTKFSDAEEYMKHLFLIDYESIRPLCTACHSVVSHAQNTGLSFEEAKIDKEVIAICKQPVDAVKFFCSSYGYSEAQLSNPTKRREAVTEILHRISK